MKLVQCLGSSEVAFIAEELQGDASHCVLHPSGSTLLCQLMLFASGEESTKTLVDELLSGDLAVLCCHKFGVEFAASVVSHGTRAQQALVVSALRCNLQRFARHRFASRVLAEALLYCGEEERFALASEIMSMPGAIVALACHNFGVDVVRTLLQVPQASKQAMHFIEQGSRRIMKDKYGVHLLQELGLSGFSVSRAAGGA